MGKILSLLFVFITMSNVSVNAKQTSTVILKNGSQLVGDIIVQRPGIDMTVAATSARFIIEESNIVSKR